MFHTFEFWSHINIQQIFLQNATKNFSDLCKMIQKLIYVDYQQSKSWSHAVRPQSVATLVTLNAESRTKL